MANERAGKLRTAMTRQEVKLWARLRELRAWDCVSVDNRQSATASTRVAFVTKHAT